MIIREISQVEPPKDNIFVMETQSNFIFIVFLETLARHQTLIEQCSFGSLLLPYIISSFSHAQINGILSSDMIAHVRMFSLLMKRAAGRAQRRI
jgi:hypothetical protein